MSWYTIITIFLTACIEIAVFLFLMKEPLKLPDISLKAICISIFGAAFMTATSLFPLSQFYLAAAEAAVLAVIVRCLFCKGMRLPLFLIFFYKIGVALWEFLFSAGLAIAFRSEGYADRASPEHLIPICLVRLLLIGIAFFVFLKRSSGKKLSFRFPAMLMLLGMFGVITLSEQHTPLVSDDQLTVWTILSLIALLAVLFFNMNQKYEMEKEVAKLKTEQTELLERDYQTLRNVYSANAKLYHDLHNHVEIMYRYLSNGQTADAAQYLENLRAPIIKITQSIWTGDDAIDYLINSKIALAAQSGVTLNANIEFPRSTNIRSMDLAAILGNLLDNAMEAAQKSSDNRRFVSLTMRRINDMLIIKVENGSDMSPIIEAGTIRTSKGDKGLHGWGLKSIRAALEHYDGTLETMYDKKVFCAVAVLFYQAVKFEASSSRQPP